MPARILIIEDDAASRELARLLLHTSGYEVLLAADGGEGMRMAGAMDPDMVLCDLQMPVADGYAVLRGLHLNPGWRKVPVVAVTAFSMPGDREAVLAAGFTDYISKPIDPETFVRQVEAFLAEDLRSTAGAASG